jgi:hypothetical protein
MKFKCYSTLFARTILLCLVVLGSGCTAVEEKPTSTVKAESVDLKTNDPQGLCPQIRKTISAPEPYASMSNPLPPSNHNISGGKMLFQEDAKPMPCENCHGFKITGMGIMFQMMKPYPRDFTCYNTMKDLSDGQLFWVIKNGSHGTRMPAYKNLFDDQIWQLVHYIRNGPVK